MTPRSFEKRPLLLFFFLYFLHLVPVVQLLFVRSQTCLLLICFTDLFCLKVLSVLFASLFFLACSSGDFGRDRTCSTGGFGHGLAC